LHLVGCFIRITDTNPVCHPASYTMATELDQGVKCLGHSFNHQPPSSAQVKERVQLYITLTSMPSWHVVG